MKLRKKTNKKLDISYFTTCVYNVIYSLSHVFINPNDVIMSMAVYC
jgi:hypothetical protein